MAELLVSYHMQGHNSEPYGIRVWEDGRAESFRTSRRVKDSSGQHVTERLPPDWYPLAELGEGALAEIQTAVENAHFEDMPAIIPAEQSLSSDYTQSEWHALTEDGPKAVVVERWAPLPEAAQPLAELIAQLTKIINKAMPSN